MRLQKANRANPAGVARKREEMVETSKFKDDANLLSESQDGGVGRLGIGWMLILHSQFILIGLLVLGAAVLRFASR